MKVNEYFIVIRPFGGFSVYADSKWVGYRLTEDDARQLVKEHHQEQKEKDKC